MVKPQDARGAAAYLSSYFVKGPAWKMTLWESVTSGAMPKSIVRVSKDLTQRTRCTMRNLRWKRAVFFIWGLDTPLPEVDVVARISATFGGTVELIPFPFWEPDRGPPVPVS